MYVDLGAERDVAGAAGLEPVRAGLDLEDPIDRRDAQAARPSSKTSAPGWRASTASEPARRGSRAVAAGWARSASSAAMWLVPLRHRVRRRDRAGSADSWRSPTRIRRAARERDRRRTRARRWDARRPTARTRGSLRGSGVRDSAAWRPRSARARPASPRRPGPGPAAAASPGRRRRDPAPGRRPKAQTIGRATAGRAPIRQIRACARAGYNSRPGPMLGSRA